MSIYIIGVILMLVGGALLHIDYLTTYKRMLKEKDNKNRIRSVIWLLFEFVTLDMRRFPLVTFLLGLALIMLKTIGLIIDFLTSDNEQQKIEINKTITLLIELTGIRDFRPIFNVIAR